MPELDGLELFLSFKNINPDNKSIITSGYHETKAMDRFKDFDDHFFLQKPFNLYELTVKINEFLKVFSIDKKYKGHEFYKWHNLLTLSCDLGRKAFVRDNNLSLDADYSVQEFIDICRNAWGKEIIKQLENKIKGEK